MKAVLYAKRSVWALLVAVTALTCGEARAQYCPQSGAGEMNGVFYYMCFDCTNNSSCGSVCVGTTSPHNTGGACGASNVQCQDACKDMIYSIVADAEKKNPKSAAEPKKAAQTPNDDGAPLIYVVEPKSSLEGGPQGQLLTYQENGQYFKAVGNHIDQTAPFMISYKPAGSSRTYYMLCIEIRNKSTDQDVNPNKEMRWVRFGQEVDPASFDNTELDTSKARKAESVVSNSAQSYDVTYAEKIYHVTSVHPFN